MKLIVIVGPTAVGKSALAIAIAKATHGEIVSADAFQFYQGLSIGTAKILPSEQEGIPHHLIDILKPEDSFSVADYQRMVREKINELMSQSITPILVGGSGLYIQSVIYDYQFYGEKRQDDGELSKLSNGELYQLVASYDETIAEQCGVTNRRRLLRSLEIISSGVRPSHNDKQLFYPDAMLIGITMERSKLYEAINHRVDIMFEKGLLDEVKRLYDRGIHSQAIAAIGYKELYRYLDGDISLEETKILIKQASRRYAKRQLTWFKNQMNPTWYQVDPLHFDDTVQAVMNTIQ